MELFVEEGLRRQRNLLLISDVITMITALFIRLLFCGLAGRGLFYLTGLGGSFFYHYLGKECRLVIWCIHPSCTLLELADIFIRHI